MTSSGFVIGVDGGGTKTRGEIADLSGKSRASHAVGPTNPNVVGIEESARILSNLILHLCRQAPCHPGNVLGAVLGLAGAAGEKIQQELRTKITQALRPGGKTGPSLEIVTDIRIALEGAFGGRPGIAVVAGTGSSIMYKTAQGNAELIGGWGRILGDEGSGYFIGLEALKAVTRDYDGASPAETLRKALASRFGLDSRFRVIEAVYRQQFPIPSLVPLVFDLAAQREKVSCGILKRAAGLLVEQIQLAILRMDDGTVGIVLYGGLVEHDTPYKEILIAELTHRFPQVRIQPPLYSAVQGAIMMALPKNQEVRKT